MINRFLSRLGLMCVVILIQSCLAHPDLPKMEQLQSALDEGSTRPTWEMVQEAVREYEDWKKGPPYLAGRESDENTLLHESVLLPFKMHADSRHFYRDRFLDRLFATYKLFWPFYVAKREIPGESFGTALCRSFYEAVIDKQQRIQLTIEDFRKAVEKFEKYKSKIVSIIKYGNLPSRHSEAAAIYNAFTKYKILFLTWWSVSGMPKHRQESLTINEVLEIVDKGMEELRILDEKEQADPGWTILVEYRQRQSEEAANRLREIDKEERPRQVKRRNDPNRRGEAGPSGQS